MVTYSEIYPTCEFRDEVGIDEIEIDGFPEICGIRNDRNGSGVFSCASKHCPKICVPVITIMRQSDSGNSIGL